MSIQTVVNEYAKVSAKRKAYKKQEDALHEQLVSYLRKHKCPTKGPFVVSLNDIERSDFSWESFAKLQLKKLGKSVKEIKALVKTAKAKAGTKIVPTLYVDVNPKWKD